MKSNIFISQFTLVKPSKMKQEHLDFGLVLPNHTRQVGATILVSSIPLKRNSSPKQQNAQLKPVLKSRQQAYFNPNSATCKKYY